MAYMPGVELEALGKSGCCGPHFTLTTLYRLHYLPTNLHPFPLAQKHTQTRRRMFRMLRVAFCPAGGTLQSGGGRWPSQRSNASGSC